MADDIALKVTHVSKHFRLPHEKNVSIKSGIVNVFRRRDKTVEMQRALRDISFDVRKGEFFGILGRNGGGKSTMLKILADIYQPTKGMVERTGKLVPFIELGVGFNPELTGRENVYLNGALLGFSRKEIDKRYDEIVAFAELEDFMDQKLKNYSSGMQVRLAFSVATRAEADILLVDEVLAVGDADFQRKCYDFFKQLKKTGKTVVFVTHDMGAVREYCDRAILINEGNITHEGKADKVADEYLKLFNASDQANDMQEGERWGNGTAHFRSVKAKATAEQLTITVNIKAKRQLNDIVVGLRVRDSEDNLVAGVNTLNASGGEKFSMRADEHKQLTFTMSNIFGTGTFAIGATIRLSDGVTICEDWTDAAQFHNIREESYYPVVCPAELTIE